ncbi:hypothetical protein [Streptomyces sp. NPDC052811]|uniref:hypothetical protein n=1 Tax=Streptomyces sp. NPDC052811 TaxID=3155731 RepID=UPI00343679F7
MAIVKRAASAGAALSLAAAGLVGLGAGSAQAAQHCTTLTTTHGARIYMCANEINANYLQMTYNVLQCGSTDERAWFMVISQCGQYPGVDGSSYDWISYNDYAITYDTPEKWCGVANGGFGVVVKVTESGNISDYQGAVTLL